MPEHLVAPAFAGRLDRWLAGELPLSRSRIQALIAQGQVTVDGQVARAAQTLRGGEAVVVTVPEQRPAGLVAQDLAVPVLFQDDHVIVVNKPPGLVVHPAAGHHDGTLVNALLPSLPEADTDDADAAMRPGIVHRLDRGTSGVLVVARTPEASAHLAAQFHAHSADRRYLALVWGAPKDRAGTIDAPLGRHPSDRKRFAVVRDGRRAITRWRLAQSQPLPGGGVVSLLICQLETGRTHQVRVHLLHLGLPVVGDPLYGRQGPVPPALVAALEGLDHQLLHAGLLGFDHPATGERVRFSAPPPPEWTPVLAAAKLDLPTEL